MLQRTSYLNPFVKKQQIDFKLQSLKHNINHIKAMNNSSIQFQKVSINKNKMKYLQNERISEIERQNYHLAYKIEKILVRKDETHNHHINFNNSSSNIKTNPSNSSKQPNSQKCKPSKTLNGPFRKTLQSRINSQNYKLLQRLQNSKPTYSTDKYIKQWQSIKSLQKNISKFQFNIIESPNLLLNSSRKLADVKDKKSDSSYYVENDSQIYHNPEKKNDIVQEKRNQFKIYKKNTPRQKFIQPNHINIEFKQNQTKDNFKKQLIEKNQQNQQFLNNQQKQPKDLEQKIQKTKSISDKLSHSNEIDQNKQSQDQKNQQIKQSYKIDIAQESEDKYKNSQDNFQAEQSKQKLEDNIQNLKKQNNQQNIHENSQNPVVEQKNQFNQIQQQKYNVDEQHQQI